MSRQSGPPRRPVRVLPLLSTTFRLTIRASLQLSSGALTLLGAPILNTQPLTSFHTASQALDRVYNAFGQIG